MDIKQLLQEALNMGASDLFLSANKPPAFKLCGQLNIAADSAPLPADELQMFRQEVLSPEAQETYRQKGSIDAGFAVGSGQRFRLNFMETSSGPALVARPIRSGNVLSFEELGLPPALADVCMASHGIILVVGATGSGKSTTLGAMINYINNNSQKHIITLEDPIEYMYQDINCLITQRELDSQSAGFAEAMRSAMRESPDVIVVGEMRDTETVQAAISAAMSGHLVLSTLHTSDAVQSVQRVIDLYPEQQRHQVAADLGSSLVAVVAQRLLPTIDDEAMIPAIELLLGTPPVRKLVEDRDYAALEETLKRGSQQGMCQFNRALFKLYKDGLISLETAEQASDSPEELQLLVKGMESGSDTFQNQYGSSEDENDTQVIDMRKLLRSALRLKASDLLLSTGTSPTLRIHGELCPLELPELKAIDTQRLLFSVLSPRQRIEFEEKREVDLALAVTVPSAENPEVMESHRFRVNGFFQRGTVGVVARVISSKIPTPESLRLPSQVLKLIQKSQGLVLVTGPTGSGKSTTLACLIDQINSTRNNHIITIEDPIEYVHRNKMSVLEQREVHSDTLSFSNALKYALRQDPDVILVGEMRDPETIGAALTAAETGHLVFATLHTNSAPQTIDRIIDSFPAHQQNQIRQQLSAALLAVVSQRLLTRKDIKGRVAAFEIMVGTPPVQALIREAKTSQLPSTLETSSKDGMITLRRSLDLLLEQDLIYKEEADSLSLEAVEVGAFK